MKLFLLLNSLAALPINENFITSKTRMDVDSLRKYKNQITKSNTKAFKSRSIQLANCYYSSARLTCVGKRVENNSGLHTTLRNNGRGQKMPFKVTGPIRFGLSHGAPVRHPHLSKKEVQKRTIVASKATQGS